MPVVDVETYPPSFDIRSCLCLKQFLERTTSELASCVSDINLLRQAPSLNSITVIFLNDLGNKC